MLMSAPPADDPRWSLELAGGALMDLGCYALHAQRVLGDFAGGEPRLVDAAGAERAGAPCVDAWADAHLEFPSGATGLARCSMTSDHWDMSLRVVGTSGEAFIPDFLYQKYDDRIIITTGARRPDRALRRRHVVHLPARAPSSTPSVTARPTAPTPTTLSRPCRSSTAATAPSGSNPARRTPRPHSPRRKARPHDHVHRFPHDRMVLRCRLLDRRLRRPRRPADAACRTTPTPTPSSATC